MTSFLNFVIITLSLLCNPAYPDFALNSPVITNYGVWDANWVQCDHNTFVKAIQLEYSPFAEEFPPPGGDGPDTDDNHGLIRIAIECSSMSDSVDLPGAVKISGRPVGSFVAPLKTACDGFATGFQLLSDEPQIALDNTGANNLRIYCSGLKENPTQYVEGYGEYTGEWTDPQFCKDRQAICGIKSQVQNSGKKHFLK